MRRGIVVGGIMLSFLFINNGINAAPRAAGASEPGATEFSAARRKHAKRTRRHHHVARKRSTINLAGYPSPLVAKAHQIERACGSRIISAFRPHARIAGSGHVSNHALKKAVDMAGNPRCIYAHLKGWPGGYSIDYGRVRHVHISYNRNKEWGIRFAHYSNRRYARFYRHHRYGG